LATVADEWNRLATDTTLAAALRKDELKTLLPALQREEQALKQAVTVGIEREQVTNTLLGVYATARAEMDQWCDRLKADPGVPDAAVFIRFYLRSRHVNGLRGVLLARTHLPDLAAEMDWARAVEQHWAQQADARDKLFVRARTPQVTASAPEWRPALDRLLALTQADPATTTSGAAKKTGVA
jgi:hypothetical protein